MMTIFKARQFGLIAATAVIVAAALPVNAQSADDNAAMKKLTEAVLGDLGIVTKPKPTTAEEDDASMRSMTDSVLAGLNGTAKPADSSAAPELSDLISKALAEGQSDSYIAALLNEAVATGDAVVPKDLKAASGGLNTDALISVLRAEAAASDGGKDETQIMRTGREASRFPFVVDMELTKRGSKHYYRVVPLDSLTAIALRAYGDAALFTAVFQANENLTSPDRISVGQLLYIPDIR